MLTDSVCASGSLYVHLLQPVYGRLSFPSATLLCIQFAALIHRGPKVMSTFHEWTQIESPCLCTTISNLPLEVDPNPRVSRQLLLLDSDSSHHPEGFDEQSCRSAGHDAISMYNLPLIWAQPAIHKSSCHRLWEDYVMYAHFSLAPFPWVSSKKGNRAHCSYFYPSSAPNRRQHGYSMRRHGKT